METPTIVRQRKMTKQEALLLASIFSVGSFFVVSVPFGIFLTVAAGFLLFAFVTRDESSQEHQEPVVLEIGSQGLTLKNAWPRALEIPWQDIQGMRLSRGRRGSVYLHIRVTEPERYVGRFMRINLALSWHHISTRISGLELSPKEVVLAIEQAQKVFLENFPDLKSAE